MWSMHKKEVIKKACSWLGVSALMGVIALVYYAFSHSLRSPYMTYLFVGPLLLSLYYWILLLVKKDDGEPASFFLGGGLMTMEAYFLLKAIYDMAEAKNSWAIALLYIGIAMLAAGLIAAPIALSKNDNTAEAASK